MKEKIPRWDWAVGSGQEAVVTRGRALGSRDRGTWQRQGFVRSCYIECEHALPAFETRILSVGKCEYSISGGK